MARARSPIPKPWLWGCDECGDLSSCHSSHPHPHPGLPEQRAAPKYSTQLGRGWPPLSRAELLGKGSCWWQAGVRVSKPTVSKPSRRMRWQQEAPNPGDAEPEEQRGWKQPPKMYAVHRAGHPASTRRHSQVWGSGRVAFLTLTAAKDHPESPLKILEVGSGWGGRGTYKGF